MFVGRFGEKRSFGISVEWQCIDLARMTILSLNF
jgi:hypothetical protein